MDAATIYQQQVRRRHRRLTPAEEHALTAAYRAGDNAAGESLIYSVLPMVIRMAAARSHLCGHGTDITDLIQVGNEGVLQAARLYDPSRGRFTTYVHPRIRRNMGRMLKSHCSPVYTPPTAKPSPQLRRARFRVHSLDLPQAGKSSGYANLILDPHAGPEELADRAEAPATLHRLLQALPPRLQKLVRMRHLEGRTYSECGREISVSTERARQLTCVALHRLRHAARAG